MSHTPFDSHFVLPAGHSQRLSFFPPSDVTNVESVSGVMAHVWLADLRSPSHRGPATSDPGRNGPVPGMCRFTKPSSVGISRLAPTIAGGPATAAGAVTSSSWA